MNYKKCPFRYIVNDDEKINIDKPITYDQFLVPISYVPTPVKMCPWTITIPNQETPRVITYPGVMPNTYIITEYGMVYNVVTNHEVLQRPNEGYMKCNLIRIDGSQYTYSVHIAWEWVPFRRDINLMINHIDGNKFNNSRFNLEWVTNRENIQHAIVTGLIPPHLNQGETHGMTKLTNEDVHNICKMLCDPRTSYDEILKIYGDKIGKQGLMDIANGRAWTHITCQYDIKHRCQSGQYHPNSKLTELDAHKICRMLQNPKTTYEEIAEEFKGKFTIYAIIDVAHGRTWKNVSDQYTIPHRELKGMHVGENHPNVKLTEKEVHVICKMLKENKYKYKEIAEMLDNKVSVYTIFRINKGKIWRHISSQYGICQSE